MTDTSEKVEACETPGFIVRPAVPGDAFNLAKYLTEILSDRRASIADLDEMKLDGLAQHEYLARIENNPLATAIIAECNSDIIGFLTCEAGKRRKIRHTAEIGMSVRSDWRRKGVATAMVRKAEQWAVATGTIKKFTLNVFEENIAAIKLYTDLGFELEGELKNQIRIGDRYQALRLMGKFIGDWTTRNKP